MKAEIITIENPSLKLLEFTKKLADGQAEKIKQIKEKYGKQETK